MAEAPWDDDPAVVYGAAIQAVFDSLGWSPERFVLPDRFIRPDLTSFDAADQEVLKSLATRFPGSRVCPYEECEAVAGETMLFVSRLRSEEEGLVRVHILQYLYGPAGIYGDGFELDLALEGDAWMLIRMKRTVED